MGLYEISRISRLNQAIYRHPFTVSNACQRVQTYAARMQSAMDDIRQAGSQTEIKLKIMEMKRLHRQIAENLDLIASRYLGPASEVTATRQRFNTWSTMHLQAAELFQQGRSAQAKALLDAEDDRQGQAAQESVRALRAFAFAKAQEFQDLSQHALSRAMLVLAVAVAASLVLAGLLVFLLARSILRPLGQVAAQSEALAAGQPVPPFSYRASDELGRLGASLRMLLSELVGETRSLKEHIPAVLWTADRELTLTFVNSEAASLAQALTGLPLENIVGSLKVGEAFRDSQELTPLLAAEVLDQGVDREAMVGFAHNGREVHLQQVIAPVRDLDGRVTGVMGVGLDISRRLEMEQDLTQREERYRTLVQNVPGAVYRCLNDEHWTMVFVSEAIEDITGYPASDFIGNQARSFESIIHPEDRAMVRQGVEEALSQGVPFTMEYRIVCAGGTERWIFEKGSEVRGERGELLYLDGVHLDITERKLAERARQRSETLYAALFERAGDAILLMIAEGDESGLIVAANQAAEKVHGYGPGELVGLQIRQLNLSERRDKVADRLRRIMAGNWVRQEVTHRRKDGSLFPLEINAGLVELDGDRYILAVERDISERKRAEAERAEREARFRELFSNMSSGVAIYRPSKDGQEFYFQDINPAGLRMGNQSLDAVVGCEVREVYPAVEEIGLLDVFKRVWATGQPESHPVTMYQDERVALWVENYVCRLPSGEVVAIYDDLTKVKQEERERAKLEGQVRQNQKLEALGTLAGGIAHDFNNILSAIMGYAELAREGVTPDSEAADDLDQVLLASDRAKNLVGQILSFARRSTEPRSPMDLGPIIKESFKLLRASVPATVEMNLREPLTKDKVDADPVQMHQLIMNLCTNAAHAMEQDGGTLEVALDRVDLGPEEAAGYAGLEPGFYVRLLVSDTGVGMDPETRRRIFEPFFTTKEPSQGTGMGLAVVHGIVQGHNGAITVYSEPGNGTVFHVYLPVHRGEAKSLEAQLLPQGLEGDESILFLDDEPALAELGERVLTRLGYRVRSFTSPREAWEAFQKAPDSFDLVVSDYTMPKMTGQELAGLIMELRPEMPVIICSGFNRLLDETWLRRLGVRAVLSKPLVARELAGTIREILD